jgi:hypothetical protein
MTTFGIDALTRLVRGKVLSRADGVLAFEDFFRAPVLCRRPLFKNWRRPAMAAGPGIGIVLS